jgi:hypothetical protein
MARHHYPRGPLRAGVAGWLRGLLSSVVRPSKQHRGRAELAAAQLGGAVFVTDHRPAGAGAATRPGQR